MSFYFKVGHVLVFAYYALLFFLYFSGSRFLNSCFIAYEQPKLLLIFLFCLFKLLLTVIQAETEDELSNWLFGFKVSNRRRIEGRGEVVRGGWKEGGEGMSLV
jgi:hypothetical protein